jgi:hypothetical protein
MREQCHTVNALNPRSKRCVDDVGPVVVANEHAALQRMEPIANLVTLENPPQTARAEWFHLFSTALIIHTQGGNGGLGQSTPPRERTGRDASVEKQHGVPGILGHRLR